MFSPSFIVLALTFQSLISFELMFACNMRYGCNVILLRMDILLSELCLSLSFPEWMFLKPWSKATACMHGFIYDLLIFFHWPICMSLYQYHSFYYCRYAVSFKNGKCESSNFVLIQDYFGYLKFHVNLNIGIPIFSRKGNWNFDRHCF